MGSSASGSLGSDGSRLSVTMRPTAFFSFLPVSKIQMVVAVALAHLLAVEAGHLGLEARRWESAASGQRQDTSPYVWLKVLAMSRAISTCCTWSLPTGTLFES